MVCQANIRRLFIQCNNLYSDTMQTTAGWRATLGLWLIHQYSNCVLHAQHDDLVPRQTLWHNNNQTKIFGGDSLVYQERYSSDTVYCPKSTIHHLLSEMASWPTPLVPVTSPTPTQHTDTDSADTPHPSWVNVIPEQSLDGVRSCSVWCHH